MYIPLYLRRFITMVLPLVIIALCVNPTHALVMSQVVLSFALIFTSKKSIMGILVNHRFTTSITWLIAVLIIALNIFLLFQTFIGQ